MARLPWWLGGDVMKQVNAKGEVEVVSPSKPLYTKPVESDGEDGGSEGQVITLLKAGTAAGSVQYPDKAVTSPVTVTIEYDASNDATTATFTSYIVGPTGKPRLLEGAKISPAIDIVSTAAVKEVVQYDIPAGFYLRIEYTAPTGGGTISITAVPE